MDRCSTRKQIWLSKRRGTPKAKTFQQSPCRPKTHASVGYAHSLRAWGSGQGGEETRHAYRR